MVFYKTWFEGVTSGIQLLSIDTDKVSVECVGGKVIIWHPHLGTMHQGVHADAGMFSVGIHGPSTIGPICLQFDRRISNVDRRTSNDISHAKHLATTNAMYLLIYYRRPLSILPVIVSTLHTPCNPVPLPHSANALTSKIPSSATSFPTTAFPTSRSTPRIISASLLPAVALSSPPSPA